MLDTKSHWNPGKWNGRLSSKNSTEQSTRHTLQNTFYRFKKNHKHLYKKRQIYWDNFQNNKLHEIMPQIGKSQKKKNQTKISRKEEIILSRLRIGHSHITHSYLLKKEEPHIAYHVKSRILLNTLTECIDLELIRKKYYLTTNLKQIFYETNPKNLLGYLKEVHLYSKIKKKQNKFPPKMLKKYL